MATTYVIGIGGTGSRIIRSLMALLTSGANTNGHEIIPILIDLDGSNEDTRRAFTFVKDYIAIRKEIYSQDTLNASDSLLKTKVNTLGENGDVEDSKLAFIDSKQKFAQYIGYSRSDNAEDSTVLLEDIDKQFIDSIYNTSTDESYEELNLNMIKGFKGHPNIGCIAFNELKDNPDFINLLNACANGIDNKIFIVSSIFGGTGASGFPQILKLIETATSINVNVSARINNIPVGALSVFPYFNVGQANDGIDNSIQSAKFMTKSKAALYYYKSEMPRLNAMYNLYDEAMATYENHSGGELQKNNAHWIELTGAYTILHFINSNITTAEQKSFGFFTAYNDTLDNLPNNISYDNFYNHTKEKVIEPILKLGITWFLCKNVIQEKERFHIDLNLDDDSSKEYRFIYKFKEFLDSYFFNLMCEIQKNGRSLQLFNFNATYLTDFLPFNLIESENKNYASLRNVSTRILNGILKENNVIEGYTPEKKMIAFLEFSTNKIFDLYNINK